MSVRRRGNSWLVIVERGKDPVTGRRIRTFLTLPTKREAEREEARLRHQVATGLDLEPTKVSVGEYLERWLAAVRPNVAPTTHQRYLGLLCHQIIPYIGGIPLAKLRPLHVQQLYARLRDHGRANGGRLAPRTLLHVHRVLSAALGQAVSWQMIHHNVCRAVEVPKARGTEMRALSPEETHILLEAAAAERSPYGDAVIVAVHTGLRLGELLGLKWGDVDLERNRLTVRRTLQYLSDEGLVCREPKTAKGRRTLPLGSKAMEVLRGLRRRQLEERLAVGPAHSGSGFVFADPLGRPLPPYRVSQRFSTLAKRLKLAPLRFHDLRHTHASLLLIRGAHPKIVSERLGHASIAITMDTYSHLLPGIQEEAAHDLDTFLSAQA